MKEGNNANYDLRLPPQSIEAEMALLGAMLSSEKNTMKASQGLEKEDFYKDCHSLIFETICRLLEKGIKVDLVTMIEECDKENTIEKVGGGAYLASLLEGHLGDSVEPYIDIIKSNHCLRSIIQISNEMRERGYKKDGPLDIINDTAGKFDEISRRLSKDIAPKKLDFANLDLNIIPTFSDDLNDIMTGFFSGDIAVIGGRKAQGKTSFAIDVAMSVAKSGGNVLFFNGKESERLLSIRILCNFLGVTTPVFKKEITSPDKLEGLKSAQKELSELSLFSHCQAGGIPINIIAQKIHARSVQNKIDLVVIDCIQNITCKEGKTRTEELELINRKFGQICRVCDCIMLVVSEVNKKNELLGSSELEYAPRQILLIEGNEGISSVSAPVEKTIEVIKNEGPLGSIKLNLYPYGSFIRKNLSSDI